MRAPHAQSGAGAAPQPDSPNDASVFEAFESNVRSYCRAFPTVFTRAKGALQWDEAGREYIDFFSGAGSLNYGHNPDFIKGRLLAYLAEDGVTHSLDMYTTAKRAFLEAFQRIVLRPRGLEYRVQFCGPTGTNAVEAAIKLARRVTGRTQVYAFTGGFHGMTLGSLAATGNRYNRDAAGVPLPYSGFLPYADGPYRMEDSLGYIDSLFSDANSGADLPAALLVEAVQAEGGIYPAPPEWLRGLRAICDRHGILLICDEIQTGCGRTGPFFAFERAGITPDLITVSKSISGYGLPMALVLMRPKYDVWKPAEHSGTFRGHQLSFVCATAALEKWTTPEFSEGVAAREALVRRVLEERVRPLHPRLAVRGAGLLYGIDVHGCGPDGTAESSSALARRAANVAFANGLISERCGRDDTVLKIMPPLNIEEAQLQKGLNILADALRAELR